MTNTIIITGSLGLIGYTATQHFLDAGFHVVGIDNDFRGKTFETNSHPSEKLSLLQKTYGDKYIHHNENIEKKEIIDKIYEQYGKDLYLTIHTAAQTSHDWAQKNPILDFSVNAVSTLYLLEAMRTYAPQSSFIFTSTNKVYGDAVNALKFEEIADRYELPHDHEYYEGITENFSIDHSTHSLFGVSKTSADLMVQEYGRYFGLNTASFRLGVVTGASQSGTIFQGYISYLLRLIKQDKTCTIFGYKGKQVRDILHAKDLASAFEMYAAKPQSGSVFNMGGGRTHSLSILELQKKSTLLFGKKMDIEIVDTPRKGDHQWWISDTSHFEKEYPSWKKNYSIDAILKDVYENLI